MRVGIDLDGVLYDFDAVLVNHVRMTRPSTAFPYDESPAFWELWGWTRGEFDACATKAVADGVLFWTGDPLPHAREAMETLMAEGHTVDIVTARTYGGYELCSAATRSWLSTYDIPFTALHFTANKCQLRVDMFLEDSIGQYDQLRRHGVDAYLLNRRLNYRADDGRHRVDSLLNFVQTVLQG